MARGFPLRPVALLAFALVLPALASPLADALDAAAFERSGSGDGWASVRFLRAEGGSVRLETRTWGAEALGFGLFRADGSLVHVGTLSAGDGRDPHGYIQVGPLGLDERVGSPGPAPQSFMGAPALSIEWLPGAPQVPPGEYVAVFWASGDAAHRFQLGGSAPLTVLASDAGTQTHYYPASAFRGTAGAGVDAGVAPIAFWGPLGKDGVGARAQLDASVRFDVASRIVGTFGPWEFLGDAYHTGAEASSVQHPQGTIDCSWGCDLNEAAPGPWTLRLTGAAVGSPDSAHVAFNGADVRFP